MTCADAGNRSRGLLAVLLAGFVALVSAGCTSAGGGEPTTTEATPTSEAAQTSTTAISLPTTVVTEKTVPEEEDVEAAVVEALGRYFSSYELATRPFDPDYPELDQVSAGRVRERIAESFARYRDDGAVSEGSYAYEVREVSFTGPSSVVVQTCSLDGLTLASREGQVLIPADETAYLTSNELELLDGSWKVTGRGYVGGKKEACELAAAS